MKNINQERLRASARHEKSFSRRKYPFWNGINVHHCYSEPRDLSWWDDIGFNLGKYYISVAWIHPRMAYDDEVDDQVYSAIKHKAPEPMWSSGAKKYRMLGKSRKKCIAKSIEFSEEESAFYAEWRNLKETKKYTSDVEIVPSIKTWSWRYARGVYITAPIEVRCQEDLIVLRDLVRDLITGKTTLAERFPGYKYTKDNWSAEFPENKDAENA